MRLKLLPFQVEATSQVLDTISSRVKAYQATRTERHPSRTAFALTSVTGSGKTVIAASVIEALLRGSTEFASQPIDGLTVLWLSYDPTLCSQTKNVFATNADEIHPTRLKIIESESFNEPKLRPGHVYFLSLPLLGSANRLTRTTDTRPNTFWDVLDATIRDEDTTLLVVVDEAHIGMGATGSAKSKSLLESVISGNTDDGGTYAGAPLVWGISATPERFQRKIKKLLPESSGGDVVVKPADVQASGLLKKSVNLYIPDESVSMHLTMLGQGVDELVHSTREWRDYCTSSGMDASDIVVPLMVAQLANRDSKGEGEESNTAAALRVEDEMIREIVRAAKARIPGFNSKNIAHVIGDRGTITVGDIEIEKIDPVSVSGRTSVQILIAKDAVSTGWDCPRAEVLVSMRPFSDPTAIAQMLGRMVRTPLARATGVDRLDRVSCWVPFFTPETVTHVVDVLTGKVDPDTGEEKASVSVVMNPQRFSLGGVSADEPVEVVEIMDDELVMASDEGVADDVVAEEVIDAGEVEVVSDEHLVHQPVSQPMVSSAPAPEPVAPMSVPSVPTHVEPSRVAPSQRAQRAEQVADCVKAIEALPSFSIPTNRIVPVKRLLDVVSLLSNNGGESDKDAGKKAIARMVARLDAEAIIHADALAKARKNIITVEQRLVTTTFDGQGTRELKLVFDGDLSIVQHEFDAADRITSGMVKEYYKAKFIEIHERGEDPNEFELKADAAALAHVDEIVTALNNEATSYADELLRRRSDSIALMAPVVQDALEALRLASRIPQPKSVVLGEDKTYSARMSGDSSNSLSESSSGKLLPKHIYCNANGMWPVPISIARNTWEMAVLERETLRDETVMWYRNPSANAKDSVSIAYRTNEGTWKTFQPDFLVVEKAHDGMKVAIVDPHWLADEAGLSRLQAFAEYVKNHGHLLTRANPVLKQTGSDVLMRLSLTKPEVYEAVMSATSVAAVFASHGEPYPLG